MHKRLPILFLFVIRHDCAYHSKKSLFYELEVLRCRTVVVWWSSLCLGTVFLSTGSQNESSAQEVDSLVKLHERDVAAYVRMRRGLARTYLSISGALGCYNQCGSCYHYRSLSYVSSKKLRCFSVCRSIRSDLHCGHRRGRYGLTLHYYCNKLDGHRASPNGTQMMIGIKRYVAKEN